MCELRETDEYGVRQWAERRTQQTRRSCFSCCFFIHIMCIHTQLFPLSSLVYHKLYVNIHVKGMIHNVFSLSLSLSLSLSDYSSVKLQYRLLFSKTAIQTILQ